MKNDKLLTVAVITVVGVILVPIVINTSINLINVVACGVGNAINKAKFNKQIKQGLKDGSIVEINGEYYKVEKEETVEEA